MDYGRSLEEDRVRSGDLAAGKTAENRLDQREDSSLLVPVSDIVLALSSTILKY